MYQLFFYREGRRKSPEMNTVAKDMSDADLTALSDFVAGLPPPPPAGGSVDEARYRRGAELARTAHLRHLPQPRLFRAASRCRAWPASARLI